MARKCNCCSHEIVGSKCTYCNYINVELLDDSGLHAEEERAEKYRKSLVKRLSDFSINAYSYKWNKKNAQLNTGRTIVKIADGDSSYKSIVWSKESFGQNLDNEQKNRNVNVLYKIDGIEKSLDVKLETIKCDDFWKLGMMINPDLTVCFYLGTSEKYTVSRPYELNFG